MSTFTWVHHAGIAFDFGVCVPSLNGLTGLMFRGLLRNFQVLCVALHLVGRCSMSELKLLHLTPPMSSIVQFLFRSSKLSQTVRLQAATQRTTDGAVPHTH